MAVATMAVDLIKKIKDESEEEEEEVESGAGSSGGGGGGGLYEGAITGVGGIGGPGLALARLM